MLNVMAKQVSEIYTTSNITISFTTTLDTSQNVHKNLLFAKHLTEVFFIKHSTSTDTYRYTRILTSVKHSKQPLNIILLYTAANLIYVI